MTNKETKELTSKDINEIEVNEPIVINCNNATRVCEPESFFEMIEQCKKCGRCV